MDRFWKKVNKTNSCWNWIACTNKAGYGIFQYKGKTLNAHRFSFELTNGFIPKGLCVCHTCDKPSCVNPKHLFLGTHKDNAQDKIKKKRDYESKKTHCPRGHKYNYKDPSRGWRRCTICDHELRRRRKNVEL